MMQTFARAHVHRVTHVTGICQHPFANVYADAIVDGMSENREVASEVNMADVARRGGVSIATVSRALRDVPGVSGSTRERIRQIADELAYVVSPEASRLSRRDTGRVAVVVPQIDVWFYSSMLAGIDLVLREAGLDVLVYQVAGEAQRRGFFAELPARRKVDAVVLIALPLLQAEVDRLDLLGVQVVVAGGRVRDFPHVEVDDHALAVRAVEYLLDLGHTRIAMIRTSDTQGTAWSSDIQRCTGYRDALAARGVTVPEDYLVTQPFGTRAGANAMAALLRHPEPPTAVFAYSDEIALSALTTVLSAGLRLPDDVSLIGVDGHPLAELFGITTMAQSVETQGRLAGEMTLRLLRDGPPGGAADRRAPGLAVVVPADLVVRTSTGPPPGSPKSGPAPPDTAA